MLTIQSLNKRFYDEMPSRQYHPTITFSPHALWGLLLALTQRGRLILLEHQAKIMM